MNADAAVTFVQTRIGILLRFVGEDIGSALADEKTELAVERLLETIADTTRHFPEALKTDCPEISWSKIIGFRNWIVHGYLGLDRNVIHGVIEHDIPKLKHAVEKYLKTHG